MRAHLSRYIVDSQREKKGIEGNPGEPAGKNKEGGLDDALLFDILFANNVNNKSPVKTATPENPTKEAKPPPQVKAKETKKALTKT